MPAARNYMDIVKYSKYTAFQHGSCQNVKGTILLWTFQLHGMVTDGVAPYTFDERQNQRTSVTDRAGLIEVISHSREPSPHPPKPLPTVQWPSLKVTCDLGLVLGDPKAPEPSPIAHDQ